MASCKPGDIVQVSNTAEQIDNSVDKTNVNFSRIIDHENRLIVNKRQIDQNTADIAGLESGHLETRIITNENNIAGLTTNSTIDRSNITSNEQAIVLAVADIETLNVNFLAMPTLYANINGSGNEVFDVADPVSPVHAINKAWADSHYSVIGAAYDKSDADIRFLAVSGTANNAQNLGGMPSSDYVLKTFIASDSTAGLVRKSTASESVAGINTDTYMTPKDVKEMINAFAAINTLTPLT